jgi:hypothetical protein
LAAADVNEFLQDQAVMSFAGTAARGSAIGTAVEGMVTYLNDSNSLSVNNGTDWTIDRTIQVFGGTAARGSAIPSPVEGMYAHINDTDTLTYYNGSAWVNFGVADLGLVLIKEQVVGSAVSSVNITSAFNSTYQNYRIVVSGVETTAANNMGITFSGSAGTTYKDYILFTAFGGATLGETSASQNRIKIAITSASGLLSFSADIFGPNTNTTTQVHSSGSSLTYGFFATGFDSNVAQHTAFTLTPTTGTLTGGTVYVYGYGEI